MLRSLFLKNWCRTVVKTTVCAVTLSSAAVFSTPAMAAVDGVIVLGKTTTEDNPTLNLATFTKDGFTEDADGSGYTITVSGDVCAIENESDSTPIPAENTIDVGKGKTLSIVRENGKNCAIRMSAGVEKPYGLEIDGSLHIIATNGTVADSDGIVYVCEQPWMMDEHAGKGAMHLKVTEAMTMNVSNVGIAAGHGDYYFGSYGVGILEGDLEVGTSEESRDFTMWMSGMTNGNADDYVTLYALGLGGGFNEEGVDTSYTFHGSVNIGCEKDENGELVDKAVKLECNKTYAISGAMVVYGVNLGDYREACDHVDPSTGDPIPPTGEGLATMTVEKDLNVKNVTVDADASNAEAYGLDVDGDRSSVTVEGATTIFNIGATTKSGKSTYAAGIEAGLGATVNLKGDVTIEKVTASGGAVNDAYAVLAFNNATANINAAASADKTVVVRGDLEKESLEEKMAQVSVDGSNAKVVMNLCNASSAFHGYTTTGAYADDSSTIDMTVSNGATWFVPWDNRLQGTLTMGNAGRVDMSTYRRDGEPFKTLTVDKLTGNSGIFQMSVDTEQATADHLVIASGSGEHYLDITDKEGSQGGDKDILVVTRQDGDASFTLAKPVEAGNYTYTLKREGDEVGACEFFLTPTALSPSAQASLSMASVGAAYSAWQGNLGNLRSRIGEVRWHSGRKGVWGQVNFWKDRADSFAGTSFSQDVMALSVGYDVKPTRRWIVGMGLSAGVHDQKGTECVGRATADANSFFVNPYGTWTHENGTYVDIVGTFGAFDQDFHLYRFGQQSMKGTYTDFGAGLSVEVGRKFSKHANIEDDGKGTPVSTSAPASNGWFVEPQAQLSFYTVFADDYTASDGSYAKRDDVTALSGRLGLVVGKDFTYGANKKTQVYIKGGYIHEFSGSQDIILNGERFSADNILGSRFYYGIGADVELRDNLNIYGEVGREEGDHYTREYDVRCGIKFTY